MPKVYLKYNAAVIKELDLTKDVTSFGRKPGNDIVIENPAVSGFHGQIVKEGDHFFIEDLNSTNGTYLNGQRIKRSPIKNHDQVSIARHILEFVTDIAAPTTGEMLAKLSTPEEPVAQKPLTADSLAGTPNQSEKPAAVPDLSEPEKPSMSMPAEAEDTSEKHPKIGILRLISGQDVPTEVLLKDLVTYVGSADQALIKLKGFMAPSLAAAISKRPEGYFLKAIKPNYPKVNGAPIKDQIFLESGALVEFGGIAMVFQYKDKDQVKTGS